MVSRVLLVLTGGRAMLVVRGAGGGLGVVLLVEGADAYCATILGQLGVCRSRIEGAQDGQLVLAEGSHAAGSYLCVVDSTSGTQGLLIIVQLI